MEFFRQDYWSGLPFPSARDLPDPGIKTKSPALQANALPSEPPWKHLVLIIIPLNRQNYFLHFINEKTSLRDAAKLASGHIANKFQSGRAGIQNWDWIYILTLYYSSPLGNWTQVSCVAGRFFTIWTIREALYKGQGHLSLYLLNARKSNINKNVEHVCFFFFFPGEVRHRTATTVRESVLQGNFLESLLCYLGR